MACGPCGLVVGRGVAVLVLVLVAGCLGPDPAGDVGFRIENRAEAAYGLNVAFLAADNGTLYDVDVIVRRGEVGTHYAPLEDGLYRLRAELTLGPGENKAADDQRLPPATATSRIETHVDGADCEKPALAELVLREGGVIEAAGQRCDP